MPYGVIPDSCECDWTFHQGQGCDNPPRNQVIVINPALCTPCLFVCTAERDEARRVGHEDARV